MASLLAMTSVSISFVFNSVILSIFIPEINSNANTFVVVNSGYTRGASANCSKDSSFTKLL